MQGAIGTVRVIAAALTFCLSATAIADPRAETGTSDPTVAFFTIRDGKLTILAGKLRSRSFKPMGIGQSPRVSPSGKFVAYNPVNDPRFNQQGIAHVIVKEIETGKLKQFRSIPPDTRPYPGCVWSDDETLLAFDVHDFESNGSKAVVDVRDDSFWRGSKEEFSARYGRRFPAERSPVSLAAVPGESDYHGYPATAVFFKPADGPPARLTPDNLWVCRPTNGAAWIASTGEVIFPAIWEADLATEGWIEKRPRPTATMFLIKPGAKDWMKATRAEWDAAALCQAEEVSTSD